MSQESKSIKKKRTSTSTPHNHSETLVNLVFIYSVLALPNHIILNPLNICILTDFCPPRVLCCKSQSEAKQSRECIFQESMCSQRDPGNHGNQTTLFTLILSPELTSRPGAVYPVHLLPRASPDAPLTCPPSSHSCFFSSFFSRFLYFFFPFFSSYIF